MDGIIYVNNGPLESQKNKEAFELIFNLIKTINFSLKHLFFVNTNADTKKTSIETCRSILNKIFEEKNESQNFIDIIKYSINKNQNEILVSKFSNSYYKLYQDFKYFKFESKTPEALINHLKENYIIIDEKKLNDFNPEDNNLKEIMENLQQHFEINDGNRKLFENICKLYLYIDNNIDDYPEYKNSNSKDFFKEFNKFIDIIKEDYLKKIHFSFYSFNLKEICNIISFILRKMYRKEPKLLSKEENDERKKIF